MIRAIASTMVCLVLCAGLAAQGTSAERTNRTKIGIEGDSVLESHLGGKHVRVAVSTRQTDIGENKPRPLRLAEATTNCTYSRVPCSEVTNLQLWVGTRRLFVPRSAFSDCADLSDMRLVTKDDLYVLEMAGGDGAEAYVVRILFDAFSVKEREVYATQAGNMIESTRYLPPVVLH